MKKDKKLAIKLINDKLNKKTYYTFEEIFSFPLFA